MLRYLTKVAQVVLIQVALLWAISHYTLVVTQHSCWELEGKEKGDWLQLCHSVVKRKLAESW